MINYRSSFISKNATINDAIHIIETSHGKIAIVVDQNDCLIGTITDGDVRRGFINGLGVNDYVVLIMNIKPTIINEKQSKDLKYLSHLMTVSQLKHIPVIDECNNKVIGLRTLTDLSYTETQQKENWVVLMAGGEGKRLRPLTENIPKPMLKIGHKPILQATIERFIEFGFSRFFISVKYKAEVIKNYFQDGAQFNAEIEYLEEDKPLHTAGALSLLREKPVSPFIVANGDILTKLDFSHLLKFHHSQNATATMGVRDYDIQVPYGVVHSIDNVFASIEEKPILNYSINAGVYVLEPKCLEYVPKNTFLGMTDLFSILQENSHKCCTYNIYDYWLDIGRIEDFNRANKELNVIFND